MISLAVVILLVIAAIFAPFLHTSGIQAYDINSLDVGPSAHHWFGTDNNGADLYSLILYGLRVPLIVGVLGTLITVGVGTLIGVASGYFGGIVDSLLARFTDLMFAFPAFILALIIVSLYGQALDQYFGGGSGRVIVLTCVFAFVSWPPLTRFVRSLALAMREQQFVEAARTSGSSNWKIIRRHLLPNMYGLILVQAALITVGIIYTETTLSIFGLGVQPPNPDLGQLLWNGAQNVELFGYLVVFPSIFLVVLLLAFTFIGDGVRDAVDPRMNS
jgi:peptide/nickel transport system permease protein